MFKRMLVGFDGSESSRRALKLALGLASEMAAAEVLAVTIVQPPEFSELEGEVDAALEESNGKLAQAVRWAKKQGALAGVKFRWQKTLGHPAETLVRIAQDEKCDLLVLGRRGHSPIRHWLLGSTTDRVVDHAPCAVMIVH